VGQIEHWAVDASVSAGSELAAVAGAVALASDSYPLYVGATALLLSGALVLSRSIVPSDIRA
jgi:hypothetical protein